MLSCDLTSLLSWATCLHRSKGGLNRAQTARLLETLISLTEQAEALEASQMKGHVKRQARPQASTGAIIDLMDWQRRTGKKGSSHVSGPHGPDQT